MAYQDIHRKIAEGAPAEARTLIEELLKVVEPDTVSVFEQLQSRPS